QQKCVEAGEQTDDDQDSARQLAVCCSVAQRCRDAIRGEILSERSDAAGSENLRQSVRNEDKPNGHAENDGRRVDRPLLQPSTLLAPVPLFVRPYLATL